MIFRWILLNILRLLLVSAIVVLLGVTLSGLLLKHESRFELKDTMIDVNTPTLSWMYKGLSEDIPAYHVGGHWYYSHDGVIYRDLLEWQQCDSHFVSVMQIEERVLLACALSLQIFDKQNTLVERIDSNLDIATPITRLGRIKQQVFFEANDNVYNIDLDTLEFFLLPLSRNVVWSEHVILSDTYKNNIPQPAKSLHTILKDIHAANFMTQPQSLLIDFLLVLVLLLLCAFIFIMFSKDMSLKTRVAESQEKNDI